MPAPPILGRPAAEVLGALGLTVQPYAAGGAVELSYTLQDPAWPVDDLALVVVRRRRRYPGWLRRGSLPVVAQPDELLDGTVVFRTDTLRVDLEDTRESVRDGRREIATLQYRYEGLPRERLPVRRIRRLLPLHGGGETVRITVFDTVDPLPREAYYYTVFVGPDAVYSADTQGSAIATGRGRFDLFRALPAVHQRTDTRTPPADSVTAADAGRGQLERFLDGFSAHADMLADGAAALADLHDTERVPARFLPAMARLLGWRLFTYTDEDDQRTELQFSPYAYRAAGSEGNLADVINRLTGWETRVREYAADVLMSFDGDRLEAVGGSAVYLDGHVQALDTAPWIDAAAVPRGSVDTADADAMFRLRTRSADDTTAYSYDAGIALPGGDYERTNETRYNRETVGVYIIPDVDTELFTLEQEWSRVREILRDFIPIQTRLVFTVLPGLEYEDARLEIVEAFSDLGIELKSEAYDPVGEAGGDTIPAWRWLTSNDINDLSVDTTSPDLSARSVHVGLL